MKNNYYSACILNKEDESECVVQAINLIGSILKAQYCEEDSNVLLICTRSAWNKTVESVDGTIASSFYTNKLNSPNKNANESQNYSNNTVYDLFNACFGQKLTKISAVDCFSKRYVDRSPDVSEEDESSDPDSLSDKSISDAYEDSIEEGSGEGTVDINDIYDNDEFRDTMNRLLIRFVDEVPSRRIIDGKLINRLPEQDQKSCFWNYIQATNEISIHDSVVDFVVVASLSDIIANSIPYYLKDNDNGDEHPFTSTLIKEGNFRYYHPKGISMYTLALATTLNAVNSRIKGLNNIRECDSRQIPRFVLVDSVPSDEEDAIKFIRFISQRFGYTFLLE